MKQGWLIVILATLLGGCSFARWIGAINVPQPTTPSNFPVVISPSGRYRAVLKTPPPPNDYGFDSFSVEDTTTGTRHEQEVYADYASGVSFEWTEDEVYLWITTDIIASSHGCDELRIYTGDGGQLVFNSRGSRASLCQGFTADHALDMDIICPNDTFLFNGYRFVPATGELTPITHEPSAADC